LLFRRIFKNFQDPKYIVTKIYRTIASGNRSITAQFFHLTNHNNLIRYSVPYSL